MAPPPSNAPSRGVLLIPAYNEQASLADLLREVDEALPGWPVIVVNDGSTDYTAEVARRHKASVLDLPCNLGVGGAVQAGILYALNVGYDFVVRIDGDGQHPPSEVHKLVQVAQEQPVDLVVGSRFGSTPQRISTRFRYVGIRVLAWFLSAVCDARVTDPTSGFWLIKRPLMRYFAKSFPTDYPEPEVLALMRRQGYVFVETPVQFRARKAGASSIQRWGTVYYALKVGLALVVDRLRPINPLCAREWTKDEL